MADEFDFNNRHYQQLLELADHLCDPSDKNLETWGGPFSAHTDPTKEGPSSPLWSAQSAEDRFEEACRRYPQLVQAWKGARLAAEQWRTRVEAEAAGRAARIAAGEPEGLA